MHPNSSIIRLPWSVQRRLDAAACALLNPRNGRAIDFTRPLGEAALYPADSLSWRIFKNPVALLIGGVAARLLELADPTPRDAGWEDPALSTGRPGPPARAASRASNRPEC